MEFKLFDLGLTDFKSAWDFQKEIFNGVRINYIPAGLVICRHYPVITSGRLTKNGDILSDNRLPVYPIERGGSVTYHGPGQLTAYPIFNLNYFKKDIHWFLRQLERVILDFLADFGIQGLTYKGKTGVWIGQQKIASIGIAVRNWITFHGLSINIKQNDLDNFKLIRPCGMDIEMVSIESVLEENVDIEGAKQNLVNKFENIFSIGRKINDQSTIAAIR